MADVMSLYTPSQENVRRHIIHSMSAMEAIGIYKIFFRYSYKDFQDHKYYDVFLFFETKQKRGDVRLTGVWGKEWLEELIKYFEARGFEWHLRTIR